METLVIKETLGIQTCLPCAEIRDAVNGERRERRDPWEEGVCFEGLVEYLIESDDPRLEKVRPDLWAEIRDEEDLQRDILLA